MAKAADLVLGTYRAFIAMDPVQMDDIDLGIPLPQFSEKILTELCNTAIEILSKRQPLVFVSSPMIIVGDIHGNMIDLLKIFHFFGDPSKHQFVFLGDYVDRGMSSVEVITLLLAFLCRFPERTVLLRGNHEFSDVNSEYGFLRDLRSTYGGDELWQLFQRVFSFLPLVAIIGREVICLHGGIGPEFESIDQIRALRFPIESCEDSLIANIVWSDPIDGVVGFGENLRGNGVTFGHDELKKFLVNNGLKALVRAHECVKNGYQLFANNMGVTVFSSSDYAKMRHNAWGVLVVMENLEVHFYCSDDAGMQPRQTLVPQHADVGLKAKQTIPVPRNAPSIMKPDAMKRVKVEPVGMKFGRKRSLSGGSTLAASSPFFYLR